MRIVIKQRGRKWEAALAIAAMLLQAACTEYGSVATIVTSDIRLPASHLAGSWRPVPKWRCGDPRNAEREELQHEARGGTWCVDNAFHVHADTAGSVRAMFVSDSGKDLDDDFSGSYVGTLVNLDGMPLLALRWDPDKEPLGFPLEVWVRVLVNGDTARLVGLQDDSLVELLKRQPRTTPHALVKGTHWSDWVVFTGNQKQLRKLAARAFRDPALLSDTVILVRTSHDVAAAEQGR